MPYFRTTHSRRESVPPAHEEEAADPNDIQHTDQVTPPRSIEHDTKLHARHLEAILSNITLAPLPEPRRHLNWLAPPPRIRLALSLSNAALVNEREYGL